MKMFYKTKHWASAANMADMEDYTSLIADSPPWTWNYYIGLANDVN